ncbi:hypothetical protein D3C84_751700 [compost metagenome]
MLFQQFKSGQRLLGMSSRLLKQVDIMSCQLVSRVRCEQIQRILQRNFDAVIRAVALPRKIEL